MKHSTLKFFPLAALLLSTSYTGISQAAISRPAPQVGSSNEVPLHVAPRVAYQKMAIESAASKSTAVRFAVDVPMSLTLADGTWDEVEPGVARWRSKVFSSEARTLNFDFSQFSLPKDGALYIYDVNGEVVQGAYTNADATADGKLWTAIVPGDTAVFELRVPMSQKHLAVLELAQVHHGFINFAKAAEVAQKAGSCEIDTICPQGDGWRDEMRSVAMITIGGNTLCTGTLMNNARQDETPYLLTAHHCGAASKAASVVAYWNFSSSGCGGNPNGNLSQNQTGAILKADHAGSDFTLLQLSTKPNPLYKVYYAGWNANPETPSAGAAMHHPQGTERRISLFNRSSYRAKISINGQAVDAWGIKWEQGTTEPGSSGAALFNNNRQVVGMLSGGDASCSNQGGTDYFARLEVAWTAESSAAGQLKAHLDPQNSGRMAMCGKDVGEDCLTGATTPAQVPVSTPPVPTPQPASGNSGSVSASASGGGSGGGSFGLSLLLGLIPALAFRKRLHS